MHVARTTKTPMDPVKWLDSAGADATRRGLPDVRAVLDGLARAAAALRAADWNADASSATGGSAETPQAAR